MFSITKSSYSFQRLIEKHKEENYQDKDGNTLAHLCVLYNHMDLLPELKKESHRKNKFGHTPEDLARLLGRKGFEFPSENQVSLKVYRTKQQKFELFSKEMIQEHFRFNYTDYLTYKNPRFLKWTTRKCHKALEDISIKWKNHWTVSMHERDYLAKRIPDIYVKWVDPLIGYGLYTASDMAQYTYIGEYTGIVKKRQNRKDLENDYIFGYVAGPHETPFVIDAKEQGNFTRFINHSDNANLFSTWMISEGICHVILFAARFIPKNSQLTYDYGPYYWNKRPAPLDL